MKRLRIVQQILIVILFAVIVPFITIGLIISNVSQQSVRRELNYNVTSISKYAAETIKKYVSNSESEFDFIALSVKNIQKNKREAYLREAEKKTLRYENLKILPKKDVKVEDVKNSRLKSIKLYSPIDDKTILSGDLLLEDLSEELVNKTNNIFQTIFIFDEDMFLIASNCGRPFDIEQIVKLLPKKRIQNQGVLFSRIKNQPLAYYEIEKPNWTVVVMTQADVTKNTIDKARSKIILCLLIAAFCIFFTVGLYTYYLYINIRQLFKGIAAISKGSYDRKIRLLKSIFTPFEIIFLEKEFNYMTQKVSSGYSEISEKNIELKRLSEYRESLVNAVSHEFRTPLTSIIGYVGRLMRQDITLSEEMKQKSLHIIKEQAQRLSRMVDDILIVPDIESVHLTINPKEVDLEKIVELCSEYSSGSNVVFSIDVKEKIKPVYADYDRLIQIITNLCDNAAKYNIDDEQPILIELKNTDFGVELKISNKSEEIPVEMMEKLYDKFIRLETDLTRTTRGTGLGLYIVKGLCDAMDIEVSIANENNLFTVTLNFKDFSNES